MVLSSWNLSWKEASFHSCLLSLSLHALIATKSILSVEAFIVPLVPNPLLLSNPTKYDPHRRSTNTAPPQIATSTTTLRAQIFVDLINEYQYLTTTFPLPTQSATFGTFAGVGDALAQQKTNQGGKEDVVVEKLRYDKKRTGRFVLKGLGAGLIWSQWYPLVDGWSDVTTAYALSELDIENIGTIHTVVKTASSIFMEQFIACPVVYSLWDIPVPALLAGIPPTKIPAIVKDKVPGLLLDNAKVWTVANVIVYNLPVQSRVFAVSVAEIFWASIVSSVATSDTTSSSSSPFEQEQDAMIDRMADEKRGKVEALLSRSLDSRIPK